MVIAYFVRHGEAETNKNDMLSSKYDGYPLTEHGRAQISETAAQLEGIEFSSAYSSPLLRARQTAEILVGKRKLDIQIDDRLRERGMGAMEGKSANKGNWIIPMLRKREYSMGVESFESISERVYSFLKGLEGDGNVIVATHESPISMLACRILGFDEFTGKGIKVGNGSVTVIEVKDKSSPRLLALGSYSIDSDYLNEVMRK
ncbi:histidine phosphatase family protein [Candidatus Marsarchaeota archaeon]|nr:histidine phosphatase family protein [Candidatus Marsarchaeota archaeon]